MSEPVFTKVWLADGRIICYRFISTGEEAAGAWFSEVDDLFSNWDGSKPLLLLVDVSRCDNQLSSEALRIASNLSNIHPDLKGKTALVIESSKPAQNVYGVVDHVLADTRERKIFSSEVEAVTWLLQI